MRTSIIMRNEFYSSVCLVQGIKNRDPKAFKYIAKNIEPKVRKMLCRYRTAIDEQNDIIQQTYLAVIIKIDENKYKENGQFEAWFKRIAKYSYFNYQKLKSKIIEYCSIYEPSEKPTMSIKEVIYHLIQNVSNLTPKEKNIIQLYFLDGLDYQEISNHLNQSINNTKVTMYRAKYKISSWIKTNDYFKSLVSGI